MNVIFWSALQTKSFLAQRYIGPYQLSHWLRKHGYTAQVIDFVVKGPDTGYPIDLLAWMTKRFIDDETLVLGVSTTFFLDREFSERLVIVLKYIKKTYPHVKLVLGGNQAESYNPDVTSLFDCVVVGMAEDILLELVEFYKTGKNEPKGVRELPHRVKFYRDSNQKRFNIEESDHRWAENDLIMPGEVLPLEISRGCIFKCKFCQYPLLGRNKNDYTRKMEHIKSELIDNYERFGTTNYYLLDDTFNDTVDKVKNFYEMTQSLPFKIKFTAYVRADLLHRFPETIPMLKDAGLAGVHFGIESFHPEMSKLVGKAWSGKHAKEFLPWLTHEAWNDEVLVHMSMIAGLARADGVMETFTQLKESVQWSIDNNIPSCNFKPLMIEKYNGSSFSSEFSKNIEEYGYYHPNPEEPLAWKHKSSEWTLDNAVYVANNLNARRDPITKFDNWVAFALLTLGYDWEEIKSTARIDFDEAERERRVKEWFKQYTLRLVELCSESLKTDTDPQSDR